MKLNRKVLAAGAAIVAIAAGGVGIAQAIDGDDSEEQVTGPSADRARAAALAEVGGGTVTSVEREDGDGQGAFEVEVRRTDGSQVEVAISDRFQVLGTSLDEDTASGSDDDDNGDDD